MFALREQGYVSAVWDNIFARRGSHFFLENIVDNNWLINVFDANDCGKNNWRHILCRFSSDVSYVKHHPGVGDIEIPKIIGNLEAAGFYPSALLSAQGLVSFFQSSPLQGSKPGSGDQSE